MINSLILDTLFVSLTLFLLYRLYERKSRLHGRLPLPPGPKGLPIVGNIWDIPAEYEWKTYHKWCKELDTDLLHLNLAGTSMIIIDTFDAATELLDRRSSLYSGRPRMPMINEVIGWDFNFAFMDYGDRWRQHRKLMHQSFHPTAVEHFHPQQLRSARNLIQKLATKDDILSELRQMAGETIMSITYGLDVQPENDPYIEIAEKGVQILMQAGVPGAFLVDGIPLLKYVPSWFPGASFKRKAKKWRALSQEVLNRPFHAMVQEMERGSQCKVSFASDGLRKMKSGLGVIYTEDNVKSVASAIYQAGADTTVATLGFCILSLLAHPALMKKAQEEIDSITDGMRLPDFSDEGSLPYISALIKETLRYWTLAPITVPRLLHVEDEYKGCRLPAGSIIMPNAWAMLHNEDIYLDPFTFNPERFLTGNKTVEHNFSASWGFGRRICPGRFMAFSSVWITLASILAVYDIEKTIGPDGKPIEPSYHCPSSLLSLPEHFQCRFIPRSSVTEQLLLLSKDVQ
ncbi:unnamed protein product [Cyclocybe aegerita]|uniref:Cytochrome P450 n=1 Tax=Cyclocybe aegerita TaxID=1973307 RepID=A0A8S0VTP7_CYCAE|nr:unnamed protein product [Cyclocybe aegerita]